MVFDSSALLAVIFDEPGGDKVINWLMEPGACISTVNWAETATKMIDGGIKPHQVELELRNFRIEIVPLDATTALKAAELRLTTRAKGLSLGDRCCLALAQTRTDARVVTADRAWKSIKGFEIQLLR
jgi:ribonuclease VapC